VTNPFFTAVQNFLLPSVSYIICAGGSQPSASLKPPITQTLLGPYYHFLILGHTDPKGHYFTDCKSVSLYVQLRLTEVLSFVLRCKLKVYF
jgi:hypothetical protein